MGKSNFQKYWSRIDNSPGNLDYASKEQLAEVKQMVKAAYHAGHGLYCKRIAELEATIEQLQGGLEWAKSDIEFCAWNCEVCDQVYPMKDTDMYDAICKALGANQGEQE